MGSRNTLAWVRCGLCGRRMRAGICNLGDRRLVLCHYCMNALRGLGYCGGEGRGARGMTRPGSRGPSSSLLKRLGAD